MKARQQAARAVSNCSVTLRETTCGIPAIRNSEDDMSTRKPKVPLLYANESPQLWLQAVTATVDRNAAAVCQRQWQNAPAVVLLRQSRLH